MQLKIRASNTWRWQSVPSTGLLEKPQHGFAKAESDWLLHIYTDCGILSERLRRVDRGTNSERTACT